MTPWDLEMIHADEEIAQFEKQKAVAEVVRLIRIHGIRLHDLQPYVREKQFESDQT